jgi:hypothetical protein
VTLKFFSVLTMKIVTFNLKLLLKYKVTPERILEKRKKKNNTSYNLTMNVFFGKISKSVFFSLIVKLFLKTL